METVKHIQRCQNPACQRVLGEIVGNGWLKIRLGVQKPYHIYVNTYVCECGWDNYIRKSTKELK